jgi:hypothetical protein
MVTKRNEEIAAGSQTAPRPTTLTVKWDDAEITNSYANVCNVSSSREEVVMVFGMNKAWEKGGTDILVKLSNRIILSPFAAKRLSLLLNNVLQQYEDRFGKLDVGAVQPAGTAGGEGASS